VCIRAASKGIVEGAEEFHRRFYDGVIFHGPSLHFHKRALDTRSDSDLDQHLEYVYAMLVSWGMHRMGSGGPKMADFKIFRDSMYAVKEEITALQQIKSLPLGIDDWTILEKIFGRIDVMKTYSYLVAHSKVLAHTIPDLISPIDREYTLTYLTGSKNFTNGIGAQWNLFKSIHTDFISEVAASESFQESAAKWLGNDQYPWDTSIPKIIDNLVIGCASSKGITAQQP